ncbi:MAG: hypothetical protein R2784_18795 [Saprospiraceae bacterium]
MYSINFNLKQTKAKNPTLIFMYVSVSKKRIKISTKQLIHPDLWDFKKQFVTNSERVIQNYSENKSGDHERVLSIKDKLNDLRNEVHKYVMVCQMQKKSLQLYELRERLYDILDNRKYVTEDRNSIVDYLNLYIEKLENGRHKA